jgi:NADH-quinone oxidoreductase subunit J
MSIHSLLFYLFAAIMIGAALGVIFARNPVHSIMFLVLTFFQSAVLWLMAEAEFLAIVLVLVYVGAVMVLFLFVVMMLDVSVESVKGGLVRYAPLAIAISLLMAVELVQLIWLKGATEGASYAFRPNPEDYDNTKELGAVLYTEHVYAFEIAAVILLLAIVAAITLTMRKRPGLKQQDISRQVAVRAKDRIRVVKMKPESKS